MTLSLAHEGAISRSTAYFEDRWDNIDDSSERAKGWQVLLLVSNKPGPIAFAEEFIPKTELGKSLWEIRKKIVASGARLLTLEEVLQEKKERRGEIDDE